MNIINAILVLGIMGGVFGLVLAIASKVFAVDVDPRQEEILNVLPGANCGGCGYPGCAGYAAAVVAGNAPINSCAAGGAECANKIAAIMGVEPGEVEKCVALVRCSGGLNATKKYEYIGIHDCLSASRLQGGGPLDCEYGCLGLGSCAAACKFGAISVSDGLAHVDHEKCVGCLACIDACPKKIIVKVPYSADIVVACSSKEKGAAIRKYCIIGCIGCKICEKACPHDAIHVVNNLASIDYSKCISCGICAQKCPRKLIKDTRLNREHDVEVSA